MGMPLMILFTFMVIPQVTFLLLLVVYYLLGLLQSYLELMRD